MYQRYRDRKFRRFQQNVIDRTYIIDKPFKMSEKTDESNTPYNIFKRNGVYDDNIAAILFYEHNRFRQLQGKLQR